MAEWMENVEKSISRIMADKVYTSSEFKRERDNFHVISQNYLGHNTLKVPLFQKAYNTKHKIILVTNLY